ncbi:MULTISPECIES: hypothetical protein [Micromonospora]|uniref:hypothetical protein n=1 Tax=Micromonospora TaxID=1873 RepID=UPI0021CA7909|nr:hypothetical protein [Micromonospora sp. Mcm103]
MAALVEHTELYFDVDYRLFAMIDDSNDRRNVSPPPHGLDQWVSSTPGYVVVENIDDAVVLGSATRLETWDGSADFDPAGWNAATSSRWSSSRASSGSPAARPAASPTPTAFRRAADEAYG